MPTILMLNGANLNRLKARDPALYGTDSLETIVEYTRSYAKEYGFEMDDFQSNHEGVLVDKIQEAEDKYTGIIINPGPFSQYSHAIRVTLGSIAIPTVEVHLVNIHKTGEITIPGRSVTGLITGFGKDSYRMGVDAIRHCLAKQNNAQSA